MNLQNQKRITHISLIVGLITTALSVTSLFAHKDIFFQSYLFSFLFWSDLALGSLPLLMIYALTGGQWGAAVRHILEALSDTAFFFAVAALVILFGLKWIYPWMDPKVASEVRVIHKQLYLNPITFSLRTLFYFLCWLSLNRLIQNHSETSYGDSNLKKRIRLRRISAGGLIIMGFSLTFASIDWQMSVEPTWYSTIYGLVYIIGQILSAFAFTLIIFGIKADQQSLQGIFPKKVLRDLGNLLLTLVIVWSYLSFMQYLIVWSGNLPHEVTWFNHRTEKGWQWLALILALFQFAAPFVLLLFRSSKDHLFRLVAIGGLIFSIRIVDHYWMLMPGIMTQGLKIPWEAMTLWIGMGGIWLALFLRRLSSKPIFAKGDRDWSIPNQSQNLPV